MVLYIIWIAGCVWNWISIRGLCFHFSESIVFLIDWLIDLIVFVDADVCGDQQGQGHLPIQRHQRLLVAVAVQPDPARGHLHHGPSALFVHHHPHHSHQLRTHDYAGHAHHRIQRVSHLFSPPPPSPPSSDTHRQTDRHTHTYIDTHLSSINLHLLYRAHNGAKSPISYSASQFSSRFHLKPISFWWYVKNISWGWMDQLVNWCDWDEWLLQYRR